jgi:hypothetical protein
MTTRIIRITECRQCPHHMAGVNECALVGYGATGHELECPPTGTPDWCPLEPASDDAAEGGK